MEKMTDKSEHWKNILIVLLMLDIKVNDEKITSKMGNRLEQTLPQRRQTNDRLVQEKMLNTISHAN